MLGVQKLLQNCERGRKTFWAILMFVIGVLKLFKRSYPTNIPREFHVETTWKRLLPRRFNVEYTWCIFRELGYQKCFPDISGTQKNCFNSSKIPSALVPGIKNDYYVRYARIIDFASCWIKIYLHFYT